jgi:hypothetical protein
MHAPTLHSTYESTATTQRRSSTAEFFLTHPILPVLRSVFLSSILWISLALALYGVYTLIASH